MDLPQSANRIWLLEHWTWGILIPSVLHGGESLVMFRRFDVDTVNLAIEMPRSALSALRQEPADFAREMRLAAAVKWYEMQIVSQAKAAEIAGVSRAEFLSALQRFGVTPFQYGADEIIQEVSRA